VLGAPYDGEGAEYEGSGAEYDGAGAEYDGAGAEYEGAGAEYDGAGAEYDGAAGAPYSESLFTFKYAGFVSLVFIEWATAPDARAAAQISFGNIVVFVTEFMLRKSLFKS
jgi:hypothetical protein